ncbi:ligand-binding domain of nuclear hormone receptor domain-containing protein [Ditylenchus destructor]|uniref:Ligand-binding domain of nuclear hormone receptor domain-containing protein n=1 Tax=Ditylenchus destructor TaxID=166010 RepID=A0AAD4MQ61_9BILA|nr:ligand-binding domain of nuclear hormone receptor domain-containing protein [Ditylenchus destructor]
MQSVNNAHPNTNASGPNTSRESLCSGSTSKALATSEDSLVEPSCLPFLSPIKIFSDSEYLTSTVSELQNVQFKPKNFARDMEMPRNCLVCGQHTNSRHYDVPSCNGCKSFFNRSLVASKTYACKLNGMCTRMHGKLVIGNITMTQGVVLFRMNLRAIKFSASVDVAKLSEKVANRRRYLSQKYGERCPVLIGKTGLVFEETIEDKIIQSLVYVELKIRKIRESSRWLSDFVMFRSIRELLESTHENVLAHANQYPKDLKWPLSIDEAIRIEASEGRPRWLMLDIFLCIEMARTMAAFLQLDYNDQEALLKQAILANALLLQAFYSWQMKSETFTMPNGCLPTVDFDSESEVSFGIPKWLIAKLSKNYRGRIADRTQLISCRTMAAMLRIQMTMEEFVLLKAVIYSHSAIHGLSERGRVLLEKESIRYSKTLMKHLQSRMGAEPGAKKYAEIISFVGCLFNGAQQIREIHVYIESVLHRPINCPPYMETIMYA